MANYADWLEGENTGCGDVGDTGEGPRILRKLAAMFGENFPSSAQEETLI